MPSETKESKDALLIVKSKAGTNCEDNDGLPPCVFRVKDGEWTAFGQALRRAKKEDCSNGGHGGILQDDLLELFEAAKLIERNPSKAVVNFVKKIEDTSFLVMLREWLAGRKDEDDYASSGDDM